MKENVKFKIGKRGYEKWKVHLLATSFPSTQPRVRLGPARARDPRAACPRTAPVSAPESSPGGGWCDTTIT